MRVLITGGAGFIGQHTANLLVARGHDVVAMDTLSPQVHGDPAAAVARFPGEVVQADVADEAAWSRLPTFDAVVHLAAETGTAQSMYERDRYQRVNIQGTRLAAIAAASAGAGIVSLSSRAVYGEGRVDAAGALLASREDDPHEPVSYYGETKSVAEGVLLDMVSDAAPAVIIRPQNVIGPGQALHNPYTGVLAAFLARLREGKPLSIYGDGRQTRDFVHVSDLARLVAWNIVSMPQLGDPRIINCGTGVRTTLTELAEHAAAASPSGRASLEYVEVHRAGDIEHACADLGRLSQIGAPLPEHSSAEAVADFVRASWHGEIAPSSAWEDALAELNRRGLAGGR
ncbi:NAD(P)-dependent oxidoreductase [Microbacterium sp. SD291]|uniref:NAD-dependent epimerase/dehydratase family protein n=1 Tax=Microbacterium sp. SD291 TaxID=2782007 RepID=UPI001A9600BF|nr:NAD-dependent epimerase/dehydratase family protein [Microbacterium sp. SD291]MBO0981010.1 NAD-dependent epimerase/dehydratase family protein [Microbacterium sp. SD291]